MLASMAVFLVFSGCKSKEKVAKVEEQGETLIEIYCSGPDYRSNNKFFRANQIGESIDQATSKKKHKSMRAPNLHPQLKQR